MKKTTLTIALTICLIVCSSCSGPDIPDGQFETVVFETAIPASSEETVSEFTSAVTEVLEDTQTVVDPDTGCISGYTEFEYSINGNTGICRITFNIRDLSYGRIPESVGIYRINNPSDPVIERQSELFDLEVSCDDNESRQENEDHDLSVPYEIWRFSFDTIRTDSNSSLVSELYGLASEAYPDREITAHALVYDYIPVSHWDDPSPISQSMSYVLLRESIDGIPYGSGMNLAELERGPVYYEGDRGVISSLANMQQLFRYTNEGLLEVCITSYTGIGVEEENVPLLSLEECIDANIDRLDEFANCGDLYDMNKTFELYAAELIYVPYYPGVSSSFNVSSSDEGLLIPAWIVYWQQYNEEEDCYRSAMLIDAVNGELLFNGRGL